MSLNWTMPENSSDVILKYKYRYKGKEHEMMHPVLHRLIFLTMTLCIDLDGNEKHKADVCRRIDYIKKVQPDLVTLSWGSEAKDIEVWNGESWINFIKLFNPNPRFNDKGKVAGLEVVIDRKWINIYWGLSTNASPKSFKKWFNFFNKRTLEMMERGY
jgi:hypothetical protein